MLRALLKCGLAIACVGTLNAQVKSPKLNTRPSRITAENYKFSIVFPRGWFVLESGAPPVLFSFAPEQAGPQGQFPPGGASIRMIVEDEAQPAQLADVLSSRADHDITANDGVGVQRKYIRGPVVTGASRALQVSFDQPALGSGEQSLRFVIVLWRYKSKVFEAELSYFKNDPNGGQHQRTVLDVMRSFRPI
jgi:hypothetical protein